MNIMTSFGPCGERSGSGSTGMFADYRLRFPFLAVVAIAILAALMSGPMLAQTAAPTLIPFQGRLTNKDGVAYANGQYTITFNIYSEAVGGATTWTERHERVGVVNGMLNVFLGSIQPFANVEGNPNDDVDFALTRYLGMAIDADDNPATADPEMVPRQMIIPAFHAKTADKMNAFNSSTGVSLGRSYGWSALFHNGDPATGHISGAKLADSGVTGDKIADSTITSADLSAALQADSLIPPGMVSAFAATVAPAGWLMCDGSAVSRTSYSRLFASIGVAHGAGNGTTTFNLPDYRGRFLRGVDSGVGLDPDSFARSPMASGGNSGNQLGSVQPDAMQGHVHLSNGDSFSTAYNPKHRIDTSGTGGGVINQNTGGPLSDGTNGAPRVAPETRPKNAYVNYIIKY